MGIRSAAKAIIINKNRILLNKCSDRHNGEYYSLPGGGQQIYETLEEAVIRECLEETGYNVSPIRFAALFEEICDNEKTRELYPDYTHKVYHIFLCELKEEAVKKPTEVDAMQTGVEWIDIQEIDNIKILPLAVNNNLMGIINSGQPIFLGSEHIPFNHG